MTCNLKYYAAANTCDGYVSFLDEYAKTCRIKIALENASDVYMEFIGKHLHGCDIILKPGSKNIPEAFFFRDKSILAADADLIKNAEFRFGLSEKPQYKPDCTALYDKMYEKLHEAKNIHDEWEQIYISQTDFAAANSHLQRILENIPDNIQNNEGKTENRFFGSMLPEGSVNYINELTSDFVKRIFIKGRPGIGKSTFMRKVAETSVKRGYDTECYYCGFDPESLDMVVIRKLGFCIFDATAPHEIFPKLLSDETLDLYSVCTKHDADVKFSAKLADIRERYSEKISEASNLLKEINEKSAAYNQTGVFDMRTAENTVAKIENTLKNQ